MTLKKYRSTLQQLINRLDNKITLSDGESKANAIVQRICYNFALNLALDLEVCESELKLLEAQRDVLQNVRNTPIWQRVNGNVRDELTRVCAKIKKIEDERNGKW